MVSRTTAVRTGVLVALFCPPVLLVSLATGQTPAPAGEMSDAKKYLDARPDLRAKLEASETFKKAEQTFPKTNLNGKTYYFVEGDIRLDRDGLLLYARDLDEKLAKHKDALDGGATGGAVKGFVAATNAAGQIVLWEPKPLKYCVLRQTFPTAQEHDMVVQNMKQATADWEKTCAVKFEYVASQDDAAPGALPPAGVTFTVRKEALDPGVIASAFFPSSVASDRHLLIGAPYTDTPFDKIGVLRHELGHILGGRHEHIRMETPPLCRKFEGSFGVNITVYDKVSVMHYFCNDFTAADQQRIKFEISALDRAATQDLYGPPGQPTGLAAPAPGALSGIVRVSPSP